MRRLIVGSGKHWPKEEGDVFLDVRPFDRVDIVHDLNVLPWPILDNDFVSVSAIHVVEHLQSLVNFMDECWRVLEVGGELYIETPHADKDNFDLMFCDPTHLLFLREHSFTNYFTKVGIENFGYTDKPWAILFVGVADGVLKFHGMPIKS